MTPPPDAALPHDPFRHADTHRAATAWQRFFEDGVRPTGLVSEAVIQSWSRCLQARLEPQRRPEFNPVTRSRIHAVLGRHHDLLAAARDEMARLQDTLAGTASTAMLLDAEGVVMQTTACEAGAEQLLLPLAARVGVSLAEDSVGTTAPGITARTGLACVVMGAEHFAAPVQRMYCAAAPIRDASGAVAAVLDLSSEHRPFGFDAAAVVGLYAAAIENRLLVAQAREQLVVCLQLDPALLDSPWAALVGVDEAGAVDWMNPAAVRLLGDGSHDAGPAASRGSAEALRSHPPAPAEDLLGCAPGQLLQIAHHGQPRRLRLANGLTVWMRVRLKGPADAPGAGLGPARGTAPGDAASAAAGTPATSHPPASGAAVPAGEPPGLSPLRGVPGRDAAAAQDAASAARATLREGEQALIEQALADCGGNISAAARRLGVSRGRVYRHLQRRGDGRTDGKADAVPAGGAGGTAPA